MFFVVVHLFTKNIIHFMFVMKVKLHVVIPIIWFYIVVNILTPIQKTTKHKIL